MTDISSLLKEKILILDGAMGTMIQRYNLGEDDFRGKKFAESNIPLKGNNDILSITRPDVVTKIHEQYLEAGADIIETNTFNGTRISQSDYNLEDFVYEINFAAARIASAAAKKFTSINPDKPRFVAGSMGPTNKTASMSPCVEYPGLRDVTYEKLVDNYMEQAEALINGGVDLLLVETIFDTLNAKAALYAINILKKRTGKKIPVMISSTTVETEGKTLSGQTMEDFYNSFREYDIMSIGLNCSYGSKQLCKHIVALSKIAPLFISIYPNAGLPNRFGKYDETPEQIGENLLPLLINGNVNIIGGCCGTTPDHIRAIAHLSSSFKPRSLPENDKLI